MEDGEEAGVGAARRAQDEDGRSHEALREAPPEERCVYSLPTRLRSSAKITELSSGGASRRAS